MYSAFQHCCYRFIQADDTTDFVVPTKGWLELAHEQDPAEDKALPQGDFLAHLPDGTLFDEVSFKRIHLCVADVLPEWAARVRSLVGRIEVEDFIVSDGSSYPLVTIRLAPTPPARRTKRRH